MQKIPGVLSQRRESLSNCHQRVSSILLGSGLDVESAQFGTTCGRGRLLRCRKPAPAVDPDTSLACAVRYICATSMSLLTGLSLIGSYVELL
jgi:hypothetical protein